MGGARKTELLNREDVRGLGLSTWPSPRLAILGHLPTRSSRKLVATSTAPIDEVLYIIRNLIFGVAVTLDQIQYQNLAYEQDTSLWSQASQVGYEYGNVSNLEIL
jgi:hypothetical protein